MADDDRLAIAFLDEPGGATAAAQLASRANPDVALAPVREGPGSWVLLGAGSEDDLKRFAPEAVIESDETRRAGSDGSTGSILTSRTGLLFIARAVVSPTIDHDAFNRWYDEVHIPDVTEAGLRRPRRFRSTDLRRYYTLYDIDSTEVFDSPELMRVKGYGEFADEVGEYTRIVAG